MVINILSCLLKSISKKSTSNIAYINDTYQNLNMALGVALKGSDSAYGKNIESELYLATCHN